MLGDRRIDDALRAEFLQQFARDFVGALVFRDFLAHYKNAVVAAHFLGHRVTQRIAHGDLDHLRAGGNFGIGERR